MFNISDISCFDEKKFYISLSLSFFLFSFLISSFFFFFPSLFLFYITIKLFIGFFIKRIKRNHAWLALISIKIKFDA